MPNNDTPRPAATPEPPPEPGNADIWPLVIEDLMADVANAKNRGDIVAVENIMSVMMDIVARVKMGEAKYGTVLQANNGRNALLDAYQERIDELIYMRQALKEIEHHKEKMLYWKARALACEAQQEKDTEALEQILADWRVLGLGGVEGENDE